MALAQKKPHATTSSFTTAEEVRKAVRRKKEFGCDILKINEFLSLDLLKSPLVDEAHRWTCRWPRTAGTSSLRQCGRRRHRAICVGGLTVPSRMPLPGASWPRSAGWVIDQEAAGAYYQTENYDAVIGAMVEHHVRVDPGRLQMAASAFASARALQRKRKPNLERSQCRSSRGVRAVTDNSYDKFAQALTRPHSSTAKVGYDKAKEFIRRSSRPAAS